MVETSWHTSQSQSNMMWKKVLSSERMKNEQTVTNIFHTSNIYQLVWLVTTTTQSWADKVPIHCWWNYSTIWIHIPVFVWQAPQFLLVKPSNLVENTKTSPAEARQNPPGKKTFCLKDVHMFPPVFLNQSPGLVVNHPWGRQLVQVLLKTHLPSKKNFKMGLEKTKE